MGENQGQVGTAVTSEDPDQLREEIERTRRELGDTVAELVAKTDVKERSRRRLEETKETVAQRTGAARRHPVPLIATGAAAAVLAVTVVVVRRR
jgi:hypothetical protein